PQWPAAGPVRVISYVQAVADCGGVDSRMTTDSPSSTSTLGSHVSEAVTVGGSGTLLHSTFASAGTLVNTGLVVSTTWIVWLQVTWLLQLSFAVQVRV